MDVSDNYDSLRDVHSSQMYYTKTLTALALELIVVWVLQSELFSELFVVWVLQEAKVTTSSAVPSL